MISKKLSAITLVLFFTCVVVLYASGRADAEQVTKVREASKNTLLLFDDNTPHVGEFYFDIDEHERLKPRENDFELVQFAPMSNTRGERWVLITVRNTAAGRRFLKREFLVATFANGDQSYPINLNESVDAGDSFTNTISFSVNKFPIVMLEIQP
jgi:hypothetical protein